MDKDYKPSIWKRFKRRFRRFVEVSVLKSKDEVNIGTPFIYSYIDFTPYIQSKKITKMRRAEKYEEVLKAKTV